MPEHPSVAAARAWLADDPDPATRDELQRWLDTGDTAALDDAFGEPLGFGTSGIRGRLGPGPSRMNRRLARRVAGGLAAHVGSGTVVVGRDARHGSAGIAGDIAAVLAGAGIRTLVLPGIVPTPLLAFAVRHLGCDAGVMVTASHNPPGENGLKVYGADGAQIAAPGDAALWSAIGSVERVLDLPLGAPDEVEGGILEAYVERAAALVPPGPRDVRLVLTSLHGVGGGPLLRLLAAAGFPEPHVVAAQAEPDPDFPTVAYPNPEEPGALDLALAEADRTAADLVLATDPDGDRLGVAVPEPDGGWRTLTGDELGALLAEQALATTDGPDRLVACSLVSSTLLGKLAAAAGVPWETTQTGFKWIVRATDRHPGRRLVFAYEEALGYAVHDLVRDKDGLTAAAAMAALAARLKAAGSSVPEQLDAIARRHGLHACRQWAVRLDGPDGARRISEAVAALTDHPPAVVDGRAVLAVERPSERVVVLHLEGAARIVVRPSGTEPKLKRYFQVVVDPVGDVDEARAEAAVALARLRDDLDRVLQL